MAIFNGEIHYKWSFSIAMLNYQRVMCLLMAVDPSTLGTTHGFSLPKIFEGQIFGGAEQRLSEVSAA